eukprot:Tbor_TRINITY_DN5692_c2_g3::TRINITY_DN5692_c2_g3_i1::g.8193::m.8193/K02872/RP-L13Ae, RPL13A; large subunit ribosomal protein L13Ae
MAAPPRRLADRRARKGIKKHRPEIIIVDMKDHVLGRAATVVAKQLLLGKKVTAVRCEKITIAGKPIRNHIKYLQFLRKRKLSNPKMGPFHHRAPTEVFLRTVRSMLPKKNKRGAHALRNLVAYEGIPTNVAGKGHRTVIPRAQRHYCYRNDRAYTVLGDLCTKVGWKYGAVVERAEKARIAKATRRHENNSKVRDAWKAARKQAVTKMAKKDVEVLKKFGQL